MPQLDPLPDDDTDASLFGMEVTPPPGGLRLDSLAPGVPLRTVEIAAAAAATATGSPAALDGLDFEEDFDSAELISLSDPPPTITYPATSSGGGGGGPSSSSEGATGVATGGHMAERGAARNAEQLGPDEVHRGFKELVRVREEYIEPDNLLSEMQDVLTSRVVSPAMLRPVLTLQ
eukprot:gene14619-17273_t